MIKNKNQEVNRKMKNIKETNYEEKSEGTNPVRVILHKMGNNFVTHAELSNGSKFWGHYYIDYETAEKDFYKRAKAFKLTERTELSTEKVIISERLKETIRNYLIDSMGFSTHDLIGLTLSELEDLIDDENNFERWCNE